MDTAGGPADVQRLAGVLLQVHPLDADPHLLRLGVTPSTITSSQPSVHSGSSYWEIWKSFGMSG